MKRQLDVEIIESKNRDWHSSIVKDSKTISEWQTCQGRDCYLFRVCSFYGLVWSCSFIAKRRYKNWHIIQIEDKFRI